ncbi:peptide deformylase [Niallia sp. NCCP-28]|uniref:peptide deformylase n=1 Tax=Niallia sp. NCCP-28 TaxID=2934712 RepID=UPI00202AD6E4|nr:peptide deformylase [Niallia sp. NCCP-28]GKU84684.1 peptide deformylase 2 [Niallia sp. NCCP-28]
MSKFTKDYMLVMDDIIREGAPILREKTKEISLPPTEEDKEELLCMLQYLKNSQNPEIAKKQQLRPGVGISANQIGLNKSMFAAYIKNSNGEDFEYTLINPKIIAHSTSMIFIPDSEGCLSIDRPIVGYVPRYKKITVRAFNLNGEEVKIKLKGFEAIVFQHEIDHLNGILFYDHINQKNPFQLPENIDIEPLS